MTLSDLEGLNEIFNDMNIHAVYLRQLSSLSSCRSWASVQPRTLGPWHSSWCAVPKTVVSVWHRALRWRWNHVVQTRRRSHRRHLSSSWPAAPARVAVVERGWRRHSAGWSPRQHQFELCVPGTGTASLEAAGPCRSACERPAAQRNWLYLRCLGEVAS